ncbi:RNaseH domain-containing protein [Streptomyces glomeratus]|uniref:pPIWI-RE RNaseH domain-containing protein n=1 Tax=Streptomyces glomeratus TaxID=284452 RepID=A0ABP6LU21_9ACTN
MLHSLRGEPTALITHAQNSRLHWPWLQDGQTERDLIKTGHAPPGRLDDELRLVRVRGCGGRESAQWWGLADPGKPHGQPAGFWVQDPQQQNGASSRERVFYSTTERPGTHAISPALDRLATRVNAAGNLTSQAGTSAWNPTLVEIAVLGCHEDDDSAAPVREKPDDPEALALARHRTTPLPCLSPSHSTSRGWPRHMSSRHWPTATGLQTRSRTHLLETRASKTQTSPMRLDCPRRRTTRPRLPTAEDGIDTCAPVCPAPVS